MKSDIKLLVKNMVCPRCISTVEKIFEDIDIKVDKVELGEIFLPMTLTEIQSDAVRSALNEVGFELIETRANKIIEDIKLATAEYLNGITSGKVKLSAFIAGRIPYDYTYLSDLFSKVESKSIEQYFIERRIEKVKELIVYDQLSFTEIAYRTGFSSVHHLSAQFKKVTGLTPSHFKNIRAIKRKPLDTI
jgi:AraC family transcriptional regulator